MNNILLLMSTTGFMNSVAGIRPYLRFSRLAPSVFYDYLCDKYNIDYIDLDAFLIKKFESFDNIFHDINVLVEFHNAYYDCNHKIWNIVDSILSNILDLNKHYSKILFFMPSFPECEMNGNIPMLLFNLLIIKYLSIKFGNIIIGGYNALRFKVFLKSKYPNETHIIKNIYTGLINNKDDLISILDGNEVLPNSLFEEINCKIHVPDNINDLKYSYQYLSKRYGLEYLNAPDGYILQSSLKTSLGCPNKCNFCSSYSTKFIRCDDQLVHDNILYLIDQGVNTIFFKDSSINPTRKVAEDLCNWIIKNNIKIQWSHSCHFKNTDADFFKMVYDAGGRYLCFGGEILDDRMLKLINKKITVDQISQGLQNSHNAGIWNLLNIISGLPYEDETAIVNTLYFIKTHKPFINDVALQKFYLLKQSGFYQHASDFRLEINSHNYVPLFGSYAFSFLDDKELPKEDKIFYESYREIDRFDYDEIEQFKNKTFQLYTDFIEPLNMVLTPQHVLFMLYDIIGDKSKIIDILNKR